tara:strand:+ start:147 stop:875 length:729 start_codon:yes stop_codon:yes gene_type:complete
MLAVRHREKRTSMIAIEMFIMATFLHVLPIHAKDNELTRRETRQGWRLLFDGASLAGWLTSDLKESARPVEANAINPHRCGAYMLIYKHDISYFELKLDFKIAEPCNSGVFFYTFPLEPRDGRDIGYSGMEVAIDSNFAGGYHDTGAIYDLSKPRSNAMKTPGEWNHLRIRCNGPLVDVFLNNIHVNSIDMRQFTEANKRPDGSTHKFDVKYSEHPQHGYIGLQDHGADIWFKNIKLRQLRR